MKTIMIGGDFGEKPKESSIMKKLAEHFEHPTLINGGNLEMLKKISTISGYDMALWSVNVNNSVEKIYPTKTKGTVLFCSKVMRKTYPDDDYGTAISRIFKMHANAVITIESSVKPFKFTLIDALGNIWVSTSDLEILANKMLELYEWTKGSIRIPSNKVIFPKHNFDNDLYSLCGIVKTIADKIENQRGGRYFGNVSTRCEKTFPSIKVDSEYVFVSARNTSKERLTYEDFVLTKLGNNVVLYDGDKAPSVDTPIQLSLYKEVPDMNFFVHGHAYMEGFPFTDNYYPCGDLREFEEIMKHITPGVSSFGINLKNHGFLIGARTMDRLSYYSHYVNFKNKVLGEEMI